MIGKSLKILSTFESCHLVTSEVEGHIQEGLENVPVSVSGLYYYKLI
jgi:hypothetical protein